VSPRWCWTLAAALCVVALSGCGGGGPQTTTPLLHGGQAPTVDVYWSLPFAGPGRRQADAVVDGINLALAQRDDTANFYRVDLIPLHDSDADGRPDLPLVASQAMRVADDPHAVLYIGDLVSEASEISIPILNQAGIPQISPASTYVGLTSALPNVTGPNEPPRYYPSQTRTFLRLVPSGAVEAAADVEAFSRLGCRHVAVGDDSSVDGSSIAKLIGLHPPPTLVSDTPIPGQAGFGGWIASLRRLGIDCVLYAGNVADGGRVAAAVHAAIPTAKIIGTDGACTSAWTTGLPASIDKLWCTAPGPSLSATAAGRTFLALYRAKYHTSNPDPAAAYGYEAMKLGLDAIAALGAQGNIKADVLSALFATRERNSPIGTYGFNRDGETTLGSYGLYQFRRGVPVFSAALTPSHVP
jgi:branched-chain amino acid transport system substrate-binding protein